MSASDAGPAEGPLTADEVQVLERAGIFKGNPSGGKRKVSVRLLSPSYYGDASGSVSSSSSGAPSASVRLVGFVSPPSDKVFELPTDQESIAALEFMGFTQATAQDIYQRWETRPEQYPYSFLEHAAGQFELRSRGDLSDTDFMTVSQNLTGISFWKIMEETTDKIKLQMVGLKKELQDAILDPRFANIFDTEDLKFWIKDTLESRSHTIAHLHRRCRNWALRGGGGKGQAGPSNIPAQDQSQ